MEMAKKNKKDKDINDQASEVIDETTDAKRESDDNGTREKGQPDENQAQQERSPQDELNEMKDKYLRLMADFDNFRKRMMREKIELLGTAAKDTIAALLPVLDDFDRAKKSADDETTNEVFSEGVSLVYNKLHRTLEAQGLKEMQSTGEPFNPEIHEAITEIPAPGPDMKGKVIDTVEKGYFLRDKLIRHAKVVVGK